MSERLRLALLVAGGYTVVAFLVGNFYPFSVFDMYSRRAQSGSRIVARQGDRITEVDRFVGWSCGELQRCQAPTNEPVDRELLGWVKSHSGNASSDVDLVRRVWHFSPPSVEDCLLQHCRAEPR